MVRYVTRRLATAVLTICGVATIVFVMIRLVPGGIVEALSGPSVAQSPELIERLKEKYGLDKPLIVQYGLWLGNAVRGDLGESLGTRSSVASELLRRGSVTIELSLLATAVSLVVGLPAGVYAALRRFSPADGAVRIAALVFLSIPEFVLGTLLIYVVSTQGLGLPVSGYIPVSEDLWGHVRSMLLPTLSLGFVTAAVVMRVVRSSVIEALGEPFVTTARAKGLGAGQVLRRHVVRNAMLPVVTMLGYRLAFLLSGTIVVETVFAWPGIGRLFIDSIYRLDYQVVQAIVLLLATIVVVGNLLTDLAYAYIDPRIRVR